MSDARGRWRTAISARNSDRSQVIGMIPYRRTRSDAFKVIHVVVTPASPSGVNHLPVRLALGGQALIPPEYFDKFGSMIVITNSMHNSVAGKNRWNPTPHSE